ncbi:O-antigen ligase family protein [Sphingomonas melonis]
MRVSDRSTSRYIPGPWVVVLFAFAVILWIGGGASRADVFGQPLVRAAAWTCLALVVLFGTTRPVRSARPVLLLLTGASLIAAIQLVPLPPGLWQSLPGRSLYNGTEAALAGPAVWRPLAIVPSTAWNALGSLIVPFVMWCLMTRVRGVGDKHFLLLLLGLVLAGMGMGMLQFAGIPLHDPLVNGGGEVSGTFANHNHFALMMACGIALVPVWVFLDGRSPGWRAPVAVGLVLFLALSIVASGSRAGTLAGIVALGCGLLMVRRPLRRTLAPYPKWVLPALIAAFITIVVGVVILSIVADRALSINRAMTIDPGQDMRHRALPTVLSMIREYFPFGAGLGSFDTVFRAHEPFNLLKPTFFNRAHDDFLEIVLDTGLAGATLLLAGFGWWLWASVRAWRAGPGADTLLARLGSVLVLLVMAASVVDYPARTPMIMALLVIAGVWLDGIPRRADASALPESAEHL